MGLHADPLSDLQSKTGYTGNPNPSSSSPPAAATTSSFSPLVAPGEQTTSLGPNFPAFHVSKDVAALTINWGMSSRFDYPTWGPDKDVAHGIPTKVNAMDSKTMIEALRLWYQMDQQSLTAVQSALYNHGYFSKADRKWQSFGSPDDTSFKAWQRALLRAARSNKTIWQVLGAKDQNDFGNNAQTYYNDAISKVAQHVASSSGSGRQPLQLHYSNPDDLKAVATKAAQDTLGYVPDNDFLDQFVKVYHGVEGGAQRKAYGGGTYTEPGSPEFLAEKKARANYRQAATAHDVAGQFQNLLQIMGVQG